MRTLLPLLFLFALGCTKSEPPYDASGQFEADEIVVSALASGTIQSLDAPEGSVLQKGQKVGQIDTQILSLQQGAAQAQVRSLEEKTLSSSPQVRILKAQEQTQMRQIQVLQERYTNALREQQRTERLVQGDAATQRQLDLARDQVALFAKELNTARAQLSTLTAQRISAEESTALQNRAVLSERPVLEKKLQQIDQQKEDASVVSPITGTVLMEYARAGELATVGKPLFKMASLDTLTLKIYLTANQLSRARLGAPVRVLLSLAKDQTKELPGTLYWISPKAEFTPRTIQTRDERANLVYSAKVHVKNDGTLKIGMYGDVKLQ